MSYTSILFRAKKYTVCTNESISVAITISSNHDAVASTLSTHNCFEAEWLNSYMHASIRVVPAYYSLPLTWMKHGKTPTNPHTACNPILFPYGLYSSTRLRSSRIPDLHDDES